MINKIIKIILIYPFVALTLIVLTPFILIWKFYNYLFKNDLKTLDDTFKDSRSMRR